MSARFMWRGFSALLVIPVLLLLGQERGFAQPVASYLPDVSYTLTTGLADGRMAFIGAEGPIDGVANPTLTAQPGQVVQITLINGDNVAHDIVVERFAGAHSAIVDRPGASTTIVFRATDEGEFVYWCTVPGHRASGMEGLFVVGTDVEPMGQDDPVPAEQEAAEIPSIVKAPDDIPAPVGERTEPVTHDIFLETTELEAQLADGTTYRFWTFNDTVPGPFIRVKVGDTVNVRLRNHEDSQMIHSVDLHAVTGPGGGADVTQALPGEELGFSFKALKPGLYVYHCATPMVAHHITNGMYGLILVEPEGGLPPVDREYYVMQGELYTDQPFGSRGRQEFSAIKLLNETPEYYTFNGAVGAISEQYPLTARVGETVRIFFGVGGPNKTSSFHVIGEIFDRVYAEGSLTAEPLTDVQTTLVPAGGAVMVEFEVDVPGDFILVDHSLSRVDRGLAGRLLVEGEDNPEIFAPHEESAAEGAAHQHGGEAAAEGGEGAEGEEAGEAQPAPEGEPAGDEAPAEETGQQ